MSGIYFRPTIEPSQERFFDPLSTLDYTTVNKLNRVFMAPFFGLTYNTKTLPVVCPGGYRGVECFACEKSGLTLSVGPGYSIIDEVLFESKESVFLDINKNTSYFDGVPKGSSTKKIYVLIYYYPVTTGMSGYSGISGLTTYTSQNPSKFIIGLSSNRNLYLNNRTRFCYLYTIYATFLNNTAISIDYVYYDDPGDSSMKRYTPTH